MFCVFKGVSTLTIVTIGLFIFAIDPLEGYHPLLQRQGAPLVHYTNPVLFPSSSLIQPYPLAAPVEASDDSSSNIVRVLIHKEFKPNGEYRGITGETTKIIVPREETENIENSSEREARRIKPANSFSGYNYNVPQNSFPEEQLPSSQNYEQATKSDSQSEDRIVEPIEHTNAHGGDTSKERLEQETSSYETSEEITDDQPSGYSYKKGNIKKDLQRDFFRSPNEKITSDDDESKDSDVKPTDKSPNVDIELLHTISEQFVLSNGKLTQLNASDFTELNKENEDPSGYYNYNVEEKSEENYKPESRYNISESIDPLNSSEEREINEETEEYSAPSTENKSYEKKYDDDDEREYQQVVKTVIEKQISQLRPQRENEEKKVQFQNNYSGRQVTPKPSFDSGPGQTGYNSRLLNFQKNDQLNQQPITSLRQKLNLVRQLQSYNNEPSNFTYDNDAKNFKTPSPSYGYNSPSESQKQQAEADELSVFLFDAPRFSSLRSANPTQQTYNEIPASYTRRPLKLQRDPIIKSHYDRTLYQNVGNTISSRPTKSSRTLNDNQDNNQWHPVTSRSIIQPPIPEKLRQINSLTRTNSKFQHGSKSSAERIAPSFQSFSSAVNGTKGNIKSAGNHPVSIQDIIRNQKDEFGSESKEGINLNQSAENGNANGPLFSLIDELTGVIQKHKDAATSSEEVLTKSKPQNSIPTHKERLFSTQTPPQFPTVRSNEPQRETNSNLPQFAGDTNVNQFGNLAPSPSSQTIPTNLRNTRQNATSTNQIQTQLTISNSTISNERHKKNEKLYYYSNDNRGTTPSPSGRVRTIMAVRPYVPANLQEGRRNRAKSPFHAFLNSLHVLHEKNKNRHSHVHELLVNSMNLRKQKNSPSEKPDTRGIGFKLTPSVYSPVPVYKVEPIPIPQSPFPGRQRPQFAVSPINSEVEVIDQANRNRGARLEGGYSLPQVVPIPVAGRSRPITSQDADTKPKEYLGDKYARLGENLFYRVHHIFKQFVPPVLHVGSDEPPK